MLLIDVWVLVAVSVLILICTTIQSAVVISQYFRIVELAEDLAECQEEKEI